MKFRLFFISMFSVLAMNLCGEKVVLEDNDTCFHCGKNLSQSFVNVGKKCSKAVVYIRCESQAKNAYHDSFGDRSFDFFPRDWWKQFFDSPPSWGEEASKQISCSAAGFLVSEDGKIVTSYHVVKGAEKIFVRVGEEDDDEGVEYQATLLSSDPTSDLALVKIEKKNCTYLELADSDTLERGSIVMVVGHPFSLTNSYSFGIVSATNRIFNSPCEGGGGTAQYFQTDASMNVGNSGGPVIRMDGKCVGVCSMIYVPQRHCIGSSGVGFAVCSNSVKKFLEKGKVERIVLGVQIQELTDQLRQGFHLPEGTKGVLVTNVNLHSLAESIGLQSGDIIVDFNGEAIKSVRHLHGILMRYSSGDSCVLTIFRNGVPQKIQFILEVKEMLDEHSFVGDVIHRFGMFVEPITADKHGDKKVDRGLIVTKIFPGSIAEKVNLKPGAIIIAVNGKKVFSINDLKLELEQVDKEKDVVLFLNHHSTFWFLAVPHPDRLQKE